MRTVTYMLLFLLFTASLMDFISSDSGRIVVCDTAGRIIAAGDYEETDFLKEIAVSDSELYVSAKCDSSKVSAVSSSTLLYRLNCLPAQMSEAIAPSFSQLSFPVVCGKPLDGFFFRQKRYG